MDHPRREPAQKTCESCGALFSCGAAVDVTCWCDAVRLTPEMLAGLRAKYRDCLCPHCLSGAANVKLPS